MICAIAIFVKTPGYSPVKSRLWPDLGRTAAERLHRASAEAVRSVVERTAAMSAVEGYWAIAESDPSAASEWRGLGHVAQGEGNLGLRMASVFGQLRASHDAVILIGADAPQLECRQLLHAADWLRSEQARLVIGRARDGGFWLFGGNRDLPGSEWTRVNYSTPDTAREFTDAMDGHGEWQELDVLQDIDSATDIAPVRAQLLALHDPTAEQSSLGHMLGEIHETAERCA